ncbi:MAG: polyphosphate kinase 1 [Flavobacteriales bacterium]
MSSTILLEKTRLHVRRHFSRHLPKWMAFHDIEHTLSVARAAVDIGRGSQLSAQQLVLVEIAALFHDTGYAFTYAGHEERSAQLAHAFLKKQGLSAASIRQVEGLILATRYAQRPRTLLQRVIRDADSAKAGQVDFIARSEGLRWELEHVRGERIPAQAWAQENLDHLLAHRFHTAYAQRRFQKQKDLNIAALERVLAKHKRVKALIPGAKDRFFDRDLSWLAFNARVLQEAQDERTPLLERLKFLAIHSSNLDEFYRVRVAQLRSLRKLGKWNRTALDVPPGRHIARINRVALQQQQALGALYRGRLLPTLKKHGIRFLDERSLDREQQAFVLDLFTQRIAPLLNTASVRRGNAAFIEDRKLYLLFALAQKGKKKRKMVLVNVPADELGRFIILPSPKGRTDLLFLDDAIRLGAPLFFHGYTPVACHAIKLSRDADLYLDEEFAENVVEKVRRSLKKRRTGVPARFLYDGAMPRAMLQQLKALLDERKPDLLRGGRYHNLSDLMGLPVPGHPDLREEPLPPLPHPALGPRRDPFAAMRKGDVLLHFPYQDFGSIVRLLQQAATDEHVERIAITLYRVAKDSLICKALVEAAKRGKQVTAFVEVQARFDEGNNLFWGEALEQAGARVIYSREGLKVHCKLLLIERREKGMLQRYAYLGTGNFNEATARIYGDMALLTTHEGITRDMAMLFSHLDDPKRRERPKHLLVAPEMLRSELEHAIDREIEQALSGKPAAILLKMNSLEDKPLIRKLYDASRAGVDIRLIVRGICSLVPGVKGQSERIAAISIVDRFLEHARAFVFHNGGKPTLHLASADWMERNMDRRIEVAFPVLDPALREEIIRFLELQWADNVKARTIDAKQTNTYRKRKKSAPAIRAQHDWYAFLAEAQA